MVFFLASRVRLCLHFCGAERNVAGASGTIGVGLVAAPALLFLMLEAAILDLVFTITLKPSTLNRQLSTSCTADYSIHGSNGDQPKSSA